MAPRLPSLHGVPIGFGNQGALADSTPTQRPHTIESFKQAIAMGASGIDAEVWSSADGVAVLVQDGRVGSKLRRKPVSRLNYDQLPEHVPTLANLLETIGTHVPLSLDVRDPAAFKPLLAAVNEAGPSAESNLWLCHPSVEQLVQWREHTKAKLVNSTRLSRLDVGPERRAAELQSSGIEAISLFHSDWTGGLVSLFHRFGCHAFGWGAKHEREVAALVDSGIDGVYSDHVDRMMAGINACYQ